MPARLLGGVGIQALYTNVFSVGKQKSKVLLKLLKFYHFDACQYPDWSCFVLQVISTKVFVLEPVLNLAS